MKKETDEEESTGGCLKWKDIVEWYLEQVEQTEIKDSIDLLQEAKRKVNLVIRRLLNVDAILVTVGEIPTSKKQEQEVLLKVHPNYVVP